MFKLSKSFDFCYGHRVYSQNVVEKYAGSSECPCHRIHGHQGNVTIHMEIEELDSRGFVIDFKELGFMKKFLDAYIDHRFIVSTQDPEFERLVGVSVKEFESLSKEVFLLDNAVSMGKMFTFVDSHTNSFFVVDWNPTSEELSKWIYKGVSKLISDSPFDCVVSKVVWSETPKTSAEYSE